MYNKSSRLLLKYKPTKYTKFPTNRAGIKLIQSATKDIFTVTTLT